MKLRLGEPIFRSVQGEGNRTGVLSIWIRLFGCNLKCEGFFQNDPTKPETYSVPEVLNNGKIYKSAKDIPILQTGCDSGYSWHPNFKHLAIDLNTSEALTQVRSLLYDGNWQHPITKNDVDLCLTGGEPLMQQPKIMDLFEHMGHRAPKYLQIETNGTKPLIDGFFRFFTYRDTIINWNISPKLFNVSGEVDAVDYENIAKYQSVSRAGCLKFVVNDREETWAELDVHVKEIRKLGIMFPIYVMPVGATYEQQTDTATLSKIANRAIDRGFHVSGRLQCVLFGNGIGT